MLLLLQLLLLVGKEWLLHCEQVDCHILGLRRLGTLKAQRFKLLLDIIICRALGGVHVRPVDGLRQTRIKILLAMEVVIVVLGLIEVALARWSDSSRPLLRRLVGAEFSWISSMVEVRVTPSLLLRTTELVVVKLFLVIGSLGGI